MTLNQKIYNELKEIKTMLTPAKKEWLSEAEASEILSISGSHLRRLRLAGVFTNVQCRPSGRGFQYNRNEIESYLVKSKP